MADVDNYRTREGSDRKVKGPVRGAATRGVNSANPRGLRQPTVPRIGGDAGPRRRRRG